MASVGAVASFLKDEKKKLSSTVSDADDPLAPHRSNVVIKPFPQYPPKWMSSARGSDASQVEQESPDKGCARRLLSCFCGCCGCENRKI
ncbi:unnamed protein product [Allacma fusca]|uniref:Uncharacterized protein n=1 Tax=Allacma fusca TaxID=39272 RepID=A0A8J2M6Z8_9HEXA|nr:unnamed protein product [Allacma fusca]